MSLATKTIVLVEDDHGQVKDMKGHLSDHCKGFEVQVIKTESDFRSRLSELASTPPTAFIIDVMLPWAEAAPDAPPPPDDVKEQRFYRAGFRCVDLLTQIPELRTTPILLYSELDADDLAEDLKNLPPTVIFRAKSEELDGGVFEVLKGGLVRSTVEDPPSRKERR